MFKGIWRDSWGPRLEYIVHQELQVFFTQPRRVSKHLRAADKNLAEKQAALDAHQRELQKVRDEMKQTHRLYVEGHITPKDSAIFTSPPSNA